MMRSASAMPAALADFPSDLAGLLGIRVLGLGSCSKACLHAFDDDPRIWLALLQNEICFENIRQRDAAAASIFKRLPNTATRLELNLCQPWWRRREDAVSDESVRLLVANLPPALKELTINISRPKRTLVEGIGEDFARSLPSQLTKLDLSTEISHAAAVALLSRLPPALTELNLHVGDCLKWDKDVFRSFAEGFPRQLRLLDIAIDGDLRGIEPLCARLARSELTSLRLYMGTVEGPEALTELVAALPCSLTELQLPFHDIDVSDKFCEELGRTLGRLQDLEELELGLPSSTSLRHALQAQCKKLTSLELSGWALGAADVRQLINFANSGRLRRLHIYLEGWQPEAGRLTSGLPPTLEEFDLYIADRNSGDEMLLALAREMPAQMKVLTLTLAECEGITTRSIQVLLSSLPTALTSLSLDFEWSIFSQLSDCNFPKKLRRLGLSGRLASSERPAQVPLVEALAGELPKLSKLRWLDLSFEGCCWRAAEAQQVLTALPAMKRVEVDFGTAIWEEDTAETWRTFLGPIRARYGSAHIRAPGFQLMDESLLEAFGQTSSTESSASDDDLSLGEYS